MKFFRRKVRLIYRAQRLFLSRARGPVVMNAETVPVACAGAVVMSAETVPVAYAGGLWIMISRFVAVLRQ